MFKHCLSIRLRAVNFFAFAVCVLFAASCSKERTISIPKRLTGSEWTMNSEAGNKTLKFLSDTECTLTEEPPQGESRTFHYDYSYHKPDLTLTPRDPERVPLTGSIIRWDSQSIGMTLHAPDGEVVFHADKSLGYYIWQR